MTSRKPKMRPGMKRHAKPPLSWGARTMWLTYSPGRSRFRLNYRIGIKVDTSSYGTCFRCQRRDDSRIFLLQCIKKSSLYRVDRVPTKRHALLIGMGGEIGILRRIKHPYIVHWESYYEDKHNLFCVLEEFKGGSMFDRIAQKGVFTEREAVPIIKMILEALHYMHDTFRVCHCHLNLDNIMFEDQSDKSPIKVMDFGMSKVVPRLRSNRVNDSSFYYLPPEAINGNYSHSTDMWSVGVIMFVMLCGYPPFYSHRNGYMYFGQKQNEQITDLILKGYDYKTTKLLVVGFIRHEQASLSACHHNNTFYTIAPLIIQQILMFYDTQLSDEASDFLSQLMQHDVDKRVNAKEALHHPWIKQRNSMEHNEVVCSTQTEFITECLFRYAVSDLFADKFRTYALLEHFQTLRQIFKALDTGKKGTISIKQFKKGISQMEYLNMSEKDVEKRFEKVQTSNVRKINFEGLLNALLHDYFVATDQRLYDALRDLDDDEDGKIRKEQLKSKVEEFNVCGKSNQILKMIDETESESLGVDKQYINYEEFLYRIHPDLNQLPVIVISNADV
eukprot:151149_1